MSYIMVACLFLGNVYCTPREDMLESKSDCLEMVKILQTQPKFGWAYCKPSKETK